VILLNLQLRFFEAADAGPGLQWLNSCEGSISRSFAGPARERDKIAILCSGETRAKRSKLVFQAQRASPPPLPKIVLMLGVNGPPVNDRELLFRHGAALDPRLP